MNTGGIEISWVAVSAICASIVAILTVLKFHGKASDRIGAAEGKAGAASILAAALQVKLENLQSELSNYKVEAAKYFISANEMTHLEARFASWIGDIKTDIRGMTDRLDRVLGERGHAN